MDIYIVRDLYVKYLRVEFAGNVHVSGIPWCPEYSESTLQFKEVLLTVDIYISTVAEHIQTAFETSIYFHSFAILAIQASPNQSFTM